MTPSEDLPEMAAEMDEHNPLTSVNGGRRVFWFLIVPALVAAGVVALLLVI